MKKILFVVHTLQVGGAEKVLINLLKNIDTKKFDITVLAIVNDGIYREDLKKMNGIKYQYVFNPFIKQQPKKKQTTFYQLGRKIMFHVWKMYIWLIKYFPKMLYRRAVKEEYDVEIAFLEGKVSKFVANSTNAKSKKIAWIHTDINNTSVSNIFKNKREERECYQTFNKIICVSEEIKKIFTERTGIKENIYVQVNPIASNEILKQSKEPITKELNHNGYVVCTVGRLVKEKGFDRLLEVHNQLIQNGLIHTLWIVGEGVERKNLESYIKRNHLELTVNLVGYTQNPYKYVKNADIFVCSSRVEGLSSALLEATILEKVIVSTNCPGTKEILGEDGKAAMIVDNKEEALYEGLKEILSNSMMRDKFKENIKLRSNLFKMDHVMKQIEKMIEE